MKISELSKKSQLSIDTIRYYEKINLIPVIKNGYYKIYNEEILNLLISIKRLRFLGLSITQINYLTKIDNLDEQNIKKVRDMLSELMDSISEKERQLYESKRMVLKMLDKLSRTENEIE